MSAAETLRRAAAVMRAQAEAATPGPWSIIPGASNVWHFPDVGMPTVVVPGNGAQRRHVRHGDAAHIASWHPAVALAVADWLDATAELAPPDAHGPDEPCETCQHVASALAVARVYLGESA